MFGQTSRMIARRGVRRFAQDINAPEHAAAVKNWKIMSAGMIAATGLLGVIVMGKVLMGGHEHHHAPSYPYLKIMKKSFPWKYSQCGLFDQECKRLAKLAAKGVQAEGH